MARKEDTRSRFLRLANARVNKALKAVTLVGNLSNRSNYSYTEADVSRIFGALEGSLRGCKRRFDSAAPARGEEFKIEA
jgi:hypothetical protein